MDPYLGEDPKRAKSSRSKAFVRALEEIQAAYTTGALHERFREPAEPVGPPTAAPEPLAAPASAATATATTSPMGNKRAHVDAVASPVASTPTASGPKSKASRKRAPTEEDLEAQVGC